MRLRREMACGPCSFFHKFIPVGVECGSFSLQIKPMEKINISEKFALFNDHWSPKVIGELNGQQVKLAKVKGEFVWHDHAEEDEMFLIMKGRLKLEFRDRVVELGEGEMCIVPRGVEHRPIAEEETWLMLLEPASTKHTGDVRDPRTVDELEWI